MKPLKPIFILLQCIILNGMAQSNWYRTLNVPKIKDGLVFKTISLTNNEYLVLSVGNDTGSQVSRVKLIVTKTDDQLNIVWTKKYDSPKYNYVYAFYESGVQISNGSVYITGGLLSSANQNVSTILKLNLNGDTLWQKFYTANGNRDVAFNGLCLTNDNKLAVTGFSQDWVNHTREGLLMKLDTLGIELWRKYILNDEAKKAMSCFKIIQDKATSKFYMCGYKYLGNNSNFTSGGSLVITDSMGNVLRQVTLNNADGGPFYDMIQTKDSNFVAGGGWNTFNDLGGYPRIKSMIVKFNRSGDTLWTLRNDIPAIHNTISNLIEKNNGDILTLGVHDTMNSHNLFPIMRLRMICMTSNGVVKWKRNSRYAYDKNYSMGPTCVTSLGDKGYLIGTWGNYNSRHVYKVLKIDTLGCDTVPGFCDYEDLTVDLKELDANEVSLKVYPNPNQGQFIIECPESSSGSDYLLTDILGRTIQSGAITNGKQAVNVAYLPNGIYTLRILSALNQNYGYKIIIQK